MSHFYQLVLPSLFPWLRDAFGLTFTELGLITTAFFVTSGVCQAMAGFVVDRFGARRVLIGGMVLMSMGAAVAAAAQHYGALVAAAALIGLGNSVFHPADYAVLNSRVAPERLGHAFSVHGLTGNIGYAAAPLTLFALASHWGWHNALWACVGVGIVMAIVVALCADEFETRRDGRGVRGLSGAVSGRFAWFNRSVVGFFAFFVAVTCTQIGLQNFAPQLLNQAHQLPLAVGAKVLTMLLFGAALGVLAGGFVAGRVKQRERAAAGALVVAALLLAISSAATLDARLAAALMIGAGFLIGVVGPLRDMMIRGVASAATMGRVYGVIYSGIDVGAALGPIVVGRCLDRERADLALFALAGGLALAALISSVVVRQLRNRAIATAARLRPSAADRSDEYFADDRRAHGPEPRR